MDDVTWFVEGDSVDKVARGLECARESPEWARRNAVCFEESKKEAVLSQGRGVSGRE